MGFGAATWPLCFVSFHMREYSLRRLMSTSGGLAVIKEGIYLPRGGFWLALRRGRRQVR